MSPRPRGRGSAAEGGREEERGPPPPARYKRGRAGSGAACAAGQGRAGQGQQGRAQRAALRSPPQRRRGGARNRPVPFCRRDHAAGAAPSRSSARLALSGDAARPRRRQGHLLSSRRSLALRRQVQPLHGRFQPAARPRQARGQAQVSDSLRVPVRDRAAHPAGTGKRCRRASAPGYRCGAFQTPPPVGHPLPSTDRGHRLPATSLGSADSVPGGLAAAGTP